MAYKPTPLPWRLFRVAFFALLSGAPVAGLVWLLLTSNALVLVGIVVVITAILDLLTERIREVNESDGS